MVSTVRWSCFGRAVDPSGTSPRQVALPVRSDVKESLSNRGIYDPLDGSLRRKFSVYGLAQHRNHPEAERELLVCFNTALFPEENLGRQTPNLLWCSDRESRHDVAKGFALI